MGEFDVDLDGDGYGEKESGRSGLPGEKTLFASEFETTDTDDPQTHVKRVPVSQLKDFDPTKTQVRKSRTGQTPRTDAFHASALSLSSLSFAHFLLSLSYCNEM